MPELPEVETIRRGLSFNIGAVLSEIELNRQDIVRARDYEPAELAGRCLEDIDRRGKYLIMSFGGHFLIVHLGMSGRFYVLPEQEPISETHVHMILHMDNGYKMLYKDARRFGGVWFTADPGPVLRKLGPEPFDPAFTIEYLFNATRNRKVAIKTFILNQSIIAGLGNIYADESLFAARITPSRPASSLSMPEAQMLHRAIIKVLTQAIKSCGTTFRDYRDGFNQEGQFQNLIQVYGRSGESCKQCSAALERVVIGGRSTHFCPKCQK